MRLDEPARRSLYEALADALGDNQADTLMNLLPSHPLADMATREDLQAQTIALRGEMAAGFAAGDRRFAELSGEMTMGFAAIERRFGQMDSRFGEIDSQFGQMLSRFGQIDSRFGEIDGRFGQIDSRFGEIDSRFGEIDSRFGQIDGRFGEIDGRFGELKSEHARDMVMLIMLNLATTALIVTLGLSGAFA